MSRLIMRRGPSPNKTFALDGEVITIGSGSKNTIVILDNDVSREHCRLQRLAVDYELHDLNSTRGTYVSGQLVRGPFALRPGHMIELGENVVLEYERAPGTSELNKVPVRAAGEPTEQSHPYLVMTQGPIPGQVHALTKTLIRVGRDLTNELVLQDSEISRFHLVLRWTNGTYVIEDLGSTNGTLLNGATLAAKTPIALSTNDIIRLATTLEFRFTWQPNDVKVDTPAGAAGGAASTAPTVKTETREAKILQPNSKRQTTMLGTGLIPGSLIGHVFLAYAREDWEPIVAPMTMLLQDSSVNVWVDQYLMQGGADWTVAVEQALSECTLLLVVVSPAALNSRYVRLAYRYFFNREKPIIPLIYSPVDDLPIELKNLKSVRYDSSDRKKTFEELTTEIRNRQKPKP
jgi:pSer/pThr/pTyr-binding forkhead associated (FHA) protein